MANREKYLILIGKNNIDFYSDLSKKILRLPLPPEVFNDLEIVNEDLASNQISNFINVNKMNPSEAIIVISDLVMFQSDIQFNPNTSQAEQKRVIEEYVNKVPFESVSYKTYTSQKTIRIFTANKSVYDRLSQILEKNQFKVQSIVPLSDYAPQGTSDLTQTAIQKIYKKFDSLKGDQFSSISEPQITSIPEDSNPPTEQEYVAESKNFKQPLITRRAIMLLGVFCVLLLILVFLLLKAFVFTSEETLSTIPDPIVQEQNIIPTPSITVIISKKNASLEIVSGKDSDSKAEELEKLLSDSGFENVSLNSQLPEGTNNFIVFSPEVAKDLQEEIISIVQNVEENFSTRISTDNDSLITIILP